MSNHIPEHYRPKREDSQNSDMTPFLGALNASEIFLRLSHLQGGEARAPAIILGYNKSQPGGTLLVFLFAHHQHNHHMGRVCVKSLGQEDLELSYFLLRLLFQFSVYCVGRIRTI